MHSTYVAQMISVAFDLAHFQIHGRLSERKIACGITALENHAERRVMILTKG